MNQLLFALSESEKSVLYELYQALAYADQIGYLLLGDKVELCRSAIVTDRKEHFPRFMEEVKRVWKIIDELIDTSTEESLTVALDSFYKYIADLAVELNVDYQQTDGVFGLININMNRFPILNTSEIKAERFKGEYMQIMRHLEKTLQIIDENPEYFSMTTYAQLDALNSSIRLALSGEDLFNMTSEMFRTIYNFRVNDKITLDILPKKALFNLPLVNAVLSLEIFNPEVYEVAQPNKVSVNTSDSSGSSSIFNMDWFYISSTVREPIMRVGVLKTTDTVVTFGPKRIQFPVCENMLDEWINFNIEENLRNFTGRPLDVPPTTNENTTAGVLAASNLPQPTAQLNPIPPSADQLRSKLKFMYEGGFSPYKHYASTKIPEFENGILVFNYGKTEFDLFENLYFATINADNYSTTSQSETIYDEQTANETSTNIETVEVMTPPNTETCMVNVSMDDIMNEQPSSMTDNGISIPVTTTETTINLIMTTDIVNNNCPAENCPAENCPAENQVKKQSTDTPTTDVDMGVLA